MKTLKPKKEGKLQRESYNKSGGTSDKQVVALEQSEVWAVAVVVMEEIVVESQAPAIRKAIRKLNMIQKVESLYWVSTPLEILDNIDSVTDEPYEELLFEPVLFVSGDSKRMVSFGAIGWIETVTYIPNFLVKPSLMKRVMVCKLKLEEELNRSGIEGLLNAIAGGGKEESPPCYEGIEEAYYLFGGVVGEGVESIEVEAHLKIEKI